jgi:hypothetical protein
MGAHDHDIDAGSVILHTVAVVQRGEGELDAIAAVTKLAEMYGPKMSVHIRREKTPVNEFGNNRELIMGAFPCVFLFERGLTDPGSVTTQHSRHMLQQFGCQFAHNHRLILLLFNQLLRHEVAREVAMSVENNFSAAHDFHRTVNSAAFRVELDAAQGKPAKSKEVKKVSASPSLPSPPWPKCTCW